MTGIVRRTRPRASGFGFRVSGLELNRDEKRETRSLVNFMVAGKANVVPYFSQAPKGYFSF